TPTGLADGLGRGGLPALRASPLLLGSPVLPHGRFGVSTIIGAASHNVNRNRTDAGTFFDMLLDALRRRLGYPDAQSFQLMGEDLALLTGEDLVEAGRAWQAALERIAPALRARVSDELTELQRQAHRFLRKYNRSVHARLAGYVEIGRRCLFAYPW